MKDQWDGGVGDVEVQGWIIGALEVASLDEKEMRGSEEEKLPDFSSIPC